MVTSDLFESFVELDRPIKASRSQDKKSRNVKSQGPDKCALKVRDRLAPQLYQFLHVCMKSPIFETNLGLKTFRILQMKLHALPQKLNHPQHKVGSHWTQRWRHNFAAEILLILFALH